MTGNNLHIDGAAVVVWLPKGQMATTPDFDPNSQLLQPPPEAWWELRGAISHAMNAIARLDGKLPWIKTANQVLSPDEIRAVWDEIGFPTLPRPVHCG